MKLKKPRKPRGIKLNGKPSYDLCEHCYGYACDPFSMSEKFRNKIDRRLKSKLCPSCGAKECKCKSSSWV